LFTVDAVAISQQIARCRIKGKILDYLLCCPLGSRAWSDVEVNNLTPVVSQHNKHIQDPKGGRGHSEEINGDQICYMVVEQRSPGLGRRFLMTPCPTSKKTNQCSQQWYENRIHAVNVTGRMEE
jgi:hypothetical protein